MAVNALNLTTQDEPAWLDLHTVDADDAAAIQRRWLPMAYDQMDAGVFEGRYRQVEYGRTLVAVEGQNRTVLKQQYTPPAYCTVSAIRQIYGHGRCGLDALAERSIGYMPGQNDYEVLLPPSEIVFFRFEQERLLRAADDLGYRVPSQGQRVLFLNGLDAAGLNEVADTLLALGPTLGQAEAAQPNPAYLDQVVLERILGILLDDAATSSRMPWVNAQRITQAARDLIDASPGEPLTVMDLCHALHVSRATLQRCFVQVYGVPPLVYLRIRRLNSVRRALKAQRGSGATVTSVAMHWGFFHLARFAHDYQQQFGELPSETLGTAPRRRSRGMALAG